MYSFFYRLLMIYNHTSANCEEKNVTFCLHENLLLKDYIPQIIITKRVINHDFYMVHQLFINNEGNMVGLE